VLKLGLYVGLALGVSFLCSLLEAVLLATRNATLSAQKAAGSRGAALLLALKQERVDDAITAILTLNTVANTLGAAMAGAQAARVFDSAWLGLFSGLMTFLVLVCSEIVPKTLGAVYNRRLSATVGWTLHGLTRAMGPVLVVSRLLTRLLTRGRELVSLSRGELAAVIATATRDGAISRDESAMLANLLRFNEIQVEDVMTPRTVAFMMSAGASVADLLAERDAHVFSRIPLYRDSRENVVGYVLLREVLSAVAENGDRSRPLEAFRREITFIPELATVGAALKQILERREPIAVVTDEHGSISGLVTLEDLTETILGVEIVDESDRVPDLRAAAARLRDRRLARLIEERHLQP
jgi:CBS domain containing-hemolysin-like protein